MVVSADNTAVRLTQRMRRGSALASCRQAVNIDVRPAGLWQIAAARSYFELPDLASWRQKNSVLLVAPGNVR
jgi:hypothetical protein